MNFSTTRSVAAGGLWQYEEFKVYGLSLAGIRTSFVLPELHIAFDVAQGFPFCLPLKKFFITHGHMDHSVGIPYIISQKAINHEPAPVFYMHESLVDPFNRMMNIWSEIEKHPYNYKFIGLKSGDTVSLNSSYFLKTFPITHRVEGFGYTLFRHVKKIKPEFEGRSPHEIALLREQGIAVVDHTDSPLWTFSGDSQIEFLESTDWIKKSKILFIETTYLDDRKSIQDARDRGHIHLKELLPKLNEIKSEKIVLCHISSRYSPAAIESILNKELPENERKRIEIFPAL